MAFATIGTRGIQAQSVDLSSKVTGTLPVPNGGLGIASGTTGQFLKFTGTETLASAADNAGGMTRVGGASATGQNVGHLALDNIFTSTYTNYLVVGYVNLVSNSSQVWLRFRTGGASGTTQEGANYKYIWTGANYGATTASISNNSGDSKFRLSGGTLSNDDYPSCYFQMQIFNAFNSGMRTSIQGTFTEFDESAGLTSYEGGGSYHGAESHTGLYILGNNQNLENYTINIYGLKDS